MAIRDKIFKQQIIGLLCCLFETMPKVRLRQISVNLIRLCLNRCSVNSCSFFKIMNYSVISASLPALFNFPRLAAVITPLSCSSSSSTIVLRISQNRCSTVHNAKTQQIRRCKACARCLLLHDTVRRRNVCVDVIAILRFYWSTPGRRSVAASCCLARTTHPARARLHS